MVFDIIVINPQFLLKPFTVLNSEVSIKSLNENRKMHRRTDTVCGNSYPWPTEIACFRQPKYPVHHNSTLLLKSLKIIQFDISSGLGISLTC